MFLGISRTWSRYFILAVTVAIHTHSISVGMGQGFSAVLLPQLNDTITTDEASWIASLGVISTPFGSLLSGVLAELIGRKLTLLVTALPFLVGWILMAVGHNALEYLYAGRFITGFAIGMAATLYVYLAEVSRPSERGMLAALGPVFVSLGVLAVYSMGYLIDWHIACIICAGLALLSVVVIHFLPETPPYLVSRGKYEEARVVLETLRGGKTDLVDQEINQLSQLNGKSKKLTFSEYTNQIKEPAVWKPFLILVVFFLCQEGTGMYIIVYYANGLLELTGAVIDSNVESIFVGGVRFVTSIIGSICIQNVGRRPMAMISSFGMGVSMAVVAIYVYLYGTESMDDRPWPSIPLIGLVAHVVFSMLGMLQLPWLMMGELFPLRVRGFMSGIVSSLAYFFIFAIVKVYPNLLELQLWGMMTLFSVICFSTVFFVYFFLPETRGVELTDIENSFGSKKIDDSKPEEPVYVLRL